MADPVTRSLQSLLEDQGRDAVLARIGVAVFASERLTGDRNRAIGYLMRGFGMLEGDCEETLDLYFRQCSLVVDCRDVTVMGATLANGGVNPVTGVRARWPACSRSSTPTPAAGARRLSGDPAQLPVRRRLPRSMTWPRSAVAASSAAASAASSAAIVWASFRPGKKNP